MMVEWLTMYMVQNTPKYDDVICEQPLKPTYNPIAMSVNVDEILLLNLWEDDITVTRHFIIFNVDHNLVVSRNLTDILFVIELGC